MRRASKIVAPLLAAAAVSILTGCRPKEMQRCVDEHDNVVDDKLCAGQPAATEQQGVQQRPDGHGGFIPVIIPMYRYYYGGGGGFGLGSHVYGGNYVRQPGRDYTSRGGGGFFGRLGSSARSVTRGGFGSSFGHGGGGE